MPMVDIILCLRFRNQLLIMSDGTVAAAGLFRNPGGFFSLLLFCLFHLNKKIFAVIIVVCSLYQSGQCGVSRSKFEVLTELQANACKCLLEKVGENQQCG
jgi:hypothetical protein